VVLIITAIITRWSWPNADPGTPRASLRLPGEQRRGDREPDNREQGERGAIEGAGSSPP